MSTAPENVIIIGGGPAGLAAAVYTSRANLKPLLFAGSPPGGQLTLTSDVENYPGFESILGPELIKKMRDQAIKFGTRIFDVNVTNVDFTKKVPQLQITADAFKKVTGQSSGENILQAKSIIIATGAKALWLNIESEQRLRGRGVSACATCDGFFFKNKVVAVVGGGDTAMEEAMTLTKFASKVYVIHRRDSFRASKIMQDRVLNHPQIEVIWNAGVQEVLGEQKVTGITIASVADGKTKDIILDGLFIAIGHLPDTKLFTDKILLDAKQYILTSDRAAFEKAKGKLSDISKFNLDYQTATSAQGVFAAGDCVDHVYRQAATAVGLGVGAALDVERYLSEG